MDYRKPTVKEKEKLEKSREMMVQGIEGEKDFLSRISTTAAKAARDDIRAARKLAESVPARAREGEAYEYAGYKKGGKVAMKKTKRYNDGGDVKVTELPYMGKPKDYEKDVSRYQIKEDVDKRNLAPYEKRGRGGSGGSGGGGDPMALDKMLKAKKFNYKEGGKVKSASARADGCAIRGKTRA